MSLLTNATGVICINYFRQSNRITSNYKQLSGMIVDGIQKVSRPVTDALVIVQDRSTSLPETYLWRTLDTSVW